MHVTVPKVALEKLLDRCAVAADKKSTHAWHSRLLLRAAGRKLHVAAASADAQAFSSEDVSDEVTAGEITADAKDLCARVSAMPEGDVRLEVKGSMLMIEAVGAKRRFMMPAMPGSDFAAPPLPPAGEGVALPVADLRAMLVVRDAASTDTTKSNVNAVKFSLDLGVLLTAATDGHRVVTFTRATDAPKGAKLDGMLSLRSAMILAKAIGGAAGEVRIWANDGPCVVELGHTTYRFQRPDGQFPYYEGVIPKTRATRAVFSRAALVTAFKGIDLSNKVGTKLTLSAMKLSLHCESPEEGSADDDVFLLGFEGNTPDPFGVNSEYALKALTMAAEAEAALAPAPAPPAEVVMELAGSALDAMKFIGSGAGWTLLSVVMPMRI